MEATATLTRTLKNVVIGKSRSPKDQAIFHKLTLIAFFAWVGLGADGLSSSCYGPQEAFLTLGKHPYLGIFVGIGSMLTIFIISASYSQIIELFPTGGGGYFVASKLLSPTVGMISGCALLIDYVLTIAISIASGADAMCSLLPLKWQAYKLGFAVVVLLVMILLNVRGVKESVVPLVPIFMLFLITHVFIVLYTMFTHLPNVAGLAASTRTDVSHTISEVGFWGLIFLVLKAYSMGAGTFTGIEAVSNGIPILRDPKVETAKKTMKYMAVSLAFVVMGLMLSYLIYKPANIPGKTLNAVFFEQATQNWPSGLGIIFIFVSLISEATLLFVAAQAGFLDGPRVLANMALDRWFPTKFSVLSDRLVTHNGIVIIGALALLIMVCTGGSVALLVVLYSINVFITFFLSQLGMVKHWWNVRSQVESWRKKICINGVGLILTAFILVSMVTLKFFEGGWVTLLITGALIGLAVLTRRHYANTGRLLSRLDELVMRAESNNSKAAAKRAAGLTKPVFNQNGKTAVLLVSGFNGTGLHTLFNVVRLFGESFKNFIFVEVGVVDVGNFKGPEEVNHLQVQIRNDLDRYVKFMINEGFYAEAIHDVGVDVVEESTKIARSILDKIPNAVFFGGKLLFPNESMLTRLLHNQIVFAVQKKLYQQGIPFVILPIRI